MFICILLHLFTFSWTNLLTRCLVPVSCFLLFFVSEILHRKYSRNSTGRKPPALYCRHVHGHQRRDRGEPRFEIARDENPRPCKIPMQSKLSSFHTHFVSYSGTPKNHIPLSSIRKIVISDKSGT